MSIRSYYPYRSFFLLIGVELIVQHITKKKIYRLNDAITNLSCGITSQITGVFLKIGTIALYQLLYENFALLTIRLIGGQ